MSRSFPADEVHYGAHALREDKEKNRKEKTTSKRTESEIALLAQAGIEIMKILKSKIALQLFPEMSEKPETAVQHMRRWIKGDPELYEKLQKTGYKTRSKFMNKKQANLILYYLE